MLLHLFLPLLAAVLTLPSMPVSNPEFQFRHIQVNDGLSENAVYAICQDEQGFIWFGTKDGLNRYDGVQFKVFRKDNRNGNPLGNNFIRSLCTATGTDGEPLLFIATDAGLYCMDRTHESFSPVSAVTEEGLRLSGAVNSLFFSGRRLWIATMSQGVFMYDIDENRLRHLEIEGNPVSGLVTWKVTGDPFGNVWVGSRNGLLRYNKGSGRLTPVDRLFHADSSPKYEILTIFPDDSGILWLGTWESGLVRYDSRTSGREDFLGERKSGMYVTHIRSILPFDKDNLLVGADDGLYLFHTALRTTKAIDMPRITKSLSDQNVYSIERDREGGIWIGTYFGGVNYLNPFFRGIETYFPDWSPGGLYGKAVSQFCEDEKGNLWIATEDGGLNYLDTKTKRISQPVHTSYHNIHALILDGDDLWIGTFSRGIDIYNRRTGHMRSLMFSPVNSGTINDDCIFSLYKDHRGDIYIGTPLGLSMYSHTTHQVHRIGEVTGFVYDIQEDHDGNLWIADYSGGAMMKDASGGQWHRFPEISGSKVTGITVGSMGHIILSTEGDGIHIYDRHSATFRHISDADGLPNNVIYRVLEDGDGNLWMSSNAGIICMESQRFLLYGKEDGLQSNQFNYRSGYKASDGAFYFGGIYGFSTFHPQEILSRTNNVIPKVQILDLRLLDGGALLPFPSGKEIRLPHKKASFTISYIGLSFVNPHKNRYAYRMEGIDRDWQYVGGERSVTYLNLAPGRYRFRVKASNNDDVWNEDGAELRIRVLPPPLLSLPSLILYALLAGAFVYLTFSWTTSRRREREERKLEAYKIEQERLAFKSKTDFFITIAHEIRTPISLIQAPLEEIIDSGDGNLATRDNLSLIQGNCDKLVMLVGQLLDFKKMDEVGCVPEPAIVNLTEFLRDEHRQFSKVGATRKVCVNLELPEGEDILITHDPDIMNKIVGNLMSNAIKYASSRVQLSLRKLGDGRFLLRVEDDGKGISDSQKGLVFDPFYQVEAADRSQGSGIGLALVKNLADLIEARVSIHDAVPHGSIFEIEFSGLASGTTHPEESRTDTEINRDGGPTAGSILVVDDNVELGHFIAASLRADYSTDSAASPSEAFALLEKDSYDVIISDIMMPEMDGYAFTRKLKADIRYCHIPVVLLSARTDNISKVEGLSSGAEVFIEKPFSMSFIKAQIKSLLDARRALIASFNNSPLAPYSSLAGNEQDKGFLERLNAEIEKHLCEEDFAVDSLAEILCMSRSSLQRKLKGISGVTPGDYLRRYRLKRAGELLLTSGKRINEVAWMTGFNSASYFSKAFSKVYQMLPNEFIAKHKKEKA